MVVAAPRLPERPTALAPRKIIIYFALCARCCAKHWIIIACILWRTHRHALQTGSSKTLRKLPGLKKNPAKWGWILFLVSCCQCWKRSHVQRKVTSCAWIYVLFETYSPRGLLESFSGTFLDTVVPEVNSFKLFVRRLGYDITISIKHYVKT